MDQTTTLLFVRTSRILRFKDDIVVRIVALDGTTQVDVRSKSRVGRSDLGQNAKRIREYLTLLKAELAASKKIAARHRREIAERKKVEAQLQEHQERLLLDRNGHTVMPHLAKRSVDLALIQYRDGATDYTRVLQTQNSLVTQQDVATATRGNIVANLVSMYRALGGGWQIRHGRSIVSEAVADEMRQRTNWGEVLPAGPVEAPDSEQQQHPPDGAQTR